MAVQVVVFGPDGYLLRSLQPSAAVFELAPNPHLNGWKEENIKETCFYVGSSTTISGDGGSFNC